MRSTYLTREERIDEIGRPATHVQQMRTGRMKLKAKSLREKDNWDNWGIANTEGAIYFIQAVDGGPIKVGRTEWMTRRLESLQVGNPKQLVVLGVEPLPLDELLARERELHQQFDYARVRGEWFEPVPDLVLTACQGNLESESSTSGSTLLLRSITSSSPEEGL